MAKAKGVHTRAPAGAQDLSNALRCISWGVPKIAGNINYTSHQEIFQGPGYVVLLSEVNHEARVIPIDGRPHLGTWQGIFLLEHRAAAHRRDLILTLIGEE